MKIIYITCTDKTEALKISHSLLKNKLVACCNVIENATSVYEWEGEIKEESESLVLAKTSDDLTGKVIEHVKSIHSYDCPCVVSFDVSNANGGFEQWVNNFLQ